MTDEELEEILDNHMYYVRIRLEDLERRVFELEGGLGE